MPRTGTKEDYKEWSTEQVLEWLNGVNPTIGKKYERKWREEGVDGAILDVMDANDMEVDLGMSHMHSKRVISALNQLKSSKPLIACEYVATSVNTGQLTAVRRTSRGDSPRHECFHRSLDEFKLSSRWLLGVNVLGWTKTLISDVYWRQCYSYILCTIVAGLELSYEQTVKKARNAATKQGFVLTGTQGTGKTVFGPLLANVLANHYNWDVEYRYGNQDIIISSSNPEIEKKVVIWDASVPRTSSPGLPEGDFSVIISSCNQERWSDWRQQGSWNQFAGNYIFIDPVPHAELKEMMNALGDDVKREWQGIYEIVGGVPRLCGKGNYTTDLIRKEVDTLCKSTFTADAFPAHLDKLICLQDQMSDSGNQSSVIKKYPGLLAHVFPTNSYRNQFELRSPSHYITAKLKESVASLKDDVVSTVLKKLIGANSRGLAGDIWEPFFNKKVLEAGRFLVVGFLLPACAYSQPEVLIDQQSENIAGFLEFDSLEQLKSGVRENLLGSSGIVIAKATSKQFPTIDGVLIRSDGSSCTVVGLQLTVASSSHTINERGLDSFLAFANEIQLFKERPTVELWFTQPRQCVDEGFNFTKLQPILFTKSAEQTRKRRKLNSSNKPTNWKQEHRAVKQRLAIFDFEPIRRTAPRRGNKETLSNILSVKLNGCFAESDPSSSCEGGGETDTEPPLRPFDRTLSVAAYLESNLGDLGRCIKRDVDEDFGRGEENESDVDDDEQRDLQ